MQKQRIFLTGAAGFIGAALAERLLHEGHEIFGIDNLNDYYDPSLKAARLVNLSEHPEQQNFTFQEMDLTSEYALHSSMRDFAPTAVIHLAAQAGVRYSLQNPHSYIQSNLVGHFNILEGCRQLQSDQPGQLQHLLYASSSSVYGGNTRVPFSEADKTENALSLYAATKGAGELMTNSYSHLFAIPASGLRFFTVYGPWGRPDMSPMLFAERILTGEPIKLFNEGDLWRDFTYIDDIVEAIVRLMPNAPQKTAEHPAHEVYNLGNQSPVQLMEYVETLADVLGKKPALDLVAWPPTEVYKTYADTTKLQARVGWAPETPLRDGLERFSAWFVPWFEAQKH